MAEELRWVIVIISALVIGGLLMHGLWSVRKEENPDPNTKKTISDTQEPEVELSITPEINVSNDGPDVGQIEIKLDADDINVGSMPVEDTETQEQARGEQQSAENNADTKNNGAQPKDFIILHIQMPAGLTMQGSSLLPLLLTLGFKYSPDGFFNRHQDAAGTGAVLFRLVNMYNPGTFDIDNMEQFSTAGISLFMTLPCESENLPTFNMLHSAAKKIADEFGAEIFDHNRQLLSIPTVRQYVEKVREFDI